MPYDSENHTVSSIFITYIRQCHTLTLRTKVIYDALYNANSNVLQ